MADDEPTVTEKLSAFYGVGGTPGASALGVSAPYNLVTLSELKTAFEIIDGTEETRAGMEKAAYAGIPGGTSKRPGGGLDRPAKKANPDQYAIDLLANGGTPPSGKGVVGGISYIDDYIDDTVAKANELAHAKADVMYSMIHNLLEIALEMAEQYTDSEFSSRGLGDDD